MRVLELQGEERLDGASAPCVVCKRPSTSHFRAIGLASAPLLPLHILCGARLIHAYRQALDGETPAFPLPPELLSSPPLLPGGLDG